MTTLPFDLTREEREVLMRTDLLTFLDRCFTELNPGQTMSMAPHVRIMVSKLAACVKGKGSKRLIVNLPPRSLKSITFSIAAVAWRLGLDPTANIICASYGQDLADKLARDTRTLLQSSFYQSIFPATRLSPAKQSVNDFMTTRQGFRMATSVGGVLTGRGADLIIIDDPLKPDDALSETRRNAVNEWYDNTLLSRLNNKEEGTIIIVMQRRHQDDLVGYLQSRGEVWDVFSFPAIAQEDEQHVIQTPFGREVFRRKQGEVLDPSRENLDTLLRLKQSIGTYNFEAQYQQNPSPEGGAMIKRDWLRYYETEAPLPRFSYVLQSWDTANKSGELNDFSVCTTWGVYNGRYYLLDVYRRQLNYPELKRKVVELAERNKPRQVLIEDKASGTQLIQELKSSGLYRVTSYDPPPGTDKILRLHAQSAAFEAGRVLLPNKALWLADYERELTSFPGSKFDDQVDSTTQALDYMGQHRSLDIWTKLGREY